MFFQKKSKLSIIRNWLFPDEILSMCLGAPPVGGGSAIHYRNIRASVLTISPQNSHKSEQTWSVQRLLRKTRLMDAASPRDLGWRGQSTVPGTFTEKQIPPHTLVYFTLSHSPSLGRKGEATHKCLSSQFRPFFYIPISLLKKGRDEQSHCPKDNSN